MRTTTTYIRLVSLLLFLGGRLDRHQGELLADSTTETGIFSQSLAGVASQALSGKTEFSASAGRNDHSS
jgi:hypothetical protein